MFVSKIFKMIAQAVLDQVVGQIARQINIIEDQVESPIRSLMQPILAGAWVGDGADAFVDEVESRVFPQIAAIIGAATGFGGNIQQAVDMMTNADNQAKSIVNSLTDVFGGIF